MTQEQALEICKELFPDKAENFTLEREHYIGMQWGHMDTFRIWEHSHSYRSEILATSHVSWEHAIAVLKANSEELWEQDNSPVDMESA